MAQNILCLDRGKCACADMQGDKGSIDALGLEGSQYIVIKMQACRRCGYTGKFGWVMKYRLIAGFVIVIGMALKIGRNRQFTIVLKHRQYRLVKL